VKITTWIDRGGLNCTIEFNQSERDKLNRTELAPM
jgi:hypothetical protein